MSYLSEVLADTPIGFWRLGEASGTKANDAAGFGQHGTYKNAPTLGVAGALLEEANTAATFNGTSQYVSVPDSAFLDLGDKFTLEAWVKRSATGNIDAILSKGPKAFILRILANNKVELRKYGTGTIVTSTIEISDTTKWHHVVATKEGATVKLYIDGVDRTGTVTNQTCENTTEILAIGAASESGETVVDSWFHGSIDEPAVYLNVVLTEARVKAHYLAGRTAEGKATGTGTGTGTAKGTRTRMGKGDGTGAGTGTAKGTRGRQGKAAGSGSGSGASGPGTRSRKGKAVGTGAGTGKAAGLTETPERPNRIAVREPMPMSQKLIATSPSGKPYRWGEDGNGPSLIEELNDSGSVPGGDKDLTCTLARQIGIDYGDMKRGTRIEVYGLGRTKLAEYRLERAPVVSEERVSVAPAAVGYEAHLLDDSSAQEIFLDAEIGAFGEPSARRRATFGASAKLNQNASVSVVPAGTPDPANPSSYSQVPAISHSWSRIESAAGRDAAESWYSSGGVPLGRIILDFLRVKGLGVGDANWSNIVTAAETDLGGNESKPFETLIDLNATTTTKVDLAIALNRFFISLEDFYALGTTETGAWETQWRNIRVLGRHGLPLYGIWPAVGLLASDIVANVLGRWAPQIAFTTGLNGTIKPSQFLIPHLVFKEPTTAAEMIQQATRYEIPEWGVWAGRSGPTFYMNPRGQREGAKTWRARSHQVDFEDTGKQLDKVFNGVVVVGTGTDGAIVHVGPTGCGLRFTSDRLRDDDPQNPVNELGPTAKRYAKIQMKGIATIEGMLEAGEAFLEQCKLLDGSGKAKLTGYVEDEHGKEWPYFYVKEGHEIELIGSSIPGPRYIVNSSRNRSSRSVSIDIDAPPDGFEAMMERLYAEYVGVALESA